MYNQTIGGSSDLPFLKRERVNMKNFYRTKGAYFLGVILSALSCVYTIASLNYLGYTINISFHALISGVIVGLSLAGIIWISTWIESDSEGDE